MLDTKTRCEWNGVLCTWADGAQSKRETNGIKSDKQTSKCIFILGVILLGQFIVVLNRVIFSWKSFTFCVPLCRHLLNHSNCYVSSTWNGFSFIFHFLFSLRLLCFSLVGFNLHHLLRLSISARFRWNVNLLRLPRIFLCNLFRLNGICYYFSYSFSLAFVCSRFSLLVLLCRRCLLSEIMTSTRIFFVYHFEHLSSSSFSSFVLFFCILLALLLLFSW